MFIFVRKEIYFFDTVDEIMQTADINKKLIAGYLDLLSSLSQNSKLELIAGLSKSLKLNQKVKTNSSKSLTTNFIPEKTADEIIDELKNARNFKRNIESF